MRHHRRMLPQLVIAKKRDRHALSAAEMENFVHGVADGTVGDAQIAAFAMAVLLNGMDTAERGALTTAMARSGRVLDWSALPGPTIDKHSTGGVGDKVSLLLAPILAACGAYVPMISGRGLGHTGGTLDKLEAIPGYRTRLEIDDLRRTVRDVGCAIVGAGADLAPADKRIYAVRDVTATVESEPLIVASILSKKLAAGIGGLVIDVKVGAGAFLPSADAARSLAQALIDTAGAAGLPCRALITNMDQVLGHTAGNALEVHESVEALRDPAAADPALVEVTMALCSEALVLAGLADTPEAGAAAARVALKDGRAAERFGRMVAAHGGPSDLLDRPRAHLAKAPVVREVRAERAGHVAAIDVRALGWLVVDLGGGRRRVEDQVHPAVGLSQVKAVGHRVAKGDSLATVHAASDEAAARAVETAARAFAFGEPAQRPAVRARLT